MESIASYFKPPYVQINSNHLRIKPAVDQCHKILESRTSEELHQMARILDEIFLEPENIKYKEITHDLTLAFQKRSLPDALELPDVTWRELCAILALYLVANDQKKESKKPLKHGISRNAFDSSNIDEDYYSSPWSNPLEMGRYIFAESPQLVAVINLVNLAENPNTSGLKSGDAKSAAAAILQENPLKDKTRRLFHRLYVERGYNYLRQAAKDFLALQDPHFLPKILEALSPTKKSKKKKGPDTTQISEEDRLEKQTNNAIEVLVDHITSKGIKGKPGRKKTIADIPLKNH